MMRQFDLVNDNTALCGERVIPPIAGVFQFGITNLSDRLD
jgi:hypothetical protein